MCAPDPHPHPKCTCATALVVSDMQGSHTTPAWELFTKSAFVTAGHLLDYRNCIPQAMVGSSELSAAGASTMQLQRQLRPKCWRGHAPRLPPPAHTFLHGSSVQLIA